MTVKAIKNITYLCTEAELIKLNKTCFSLVVMDKLFDIITKREKKVHTISRISINMELKRDWKGGSNLYFHKYYPATGYWYTVGYSYIKNNVNKLDYRKSTVSSVRFRS